MTETPLKTGMWENENLSQIPFKVYRGHKDSVNCCQFAFRDRKFLSGSDDGSLKLWDITTGNVLKSYENHTEAVSYCKLTPDGKRMLSSSWDKYICMWDMETGSVIWSKKHQGLVTSCDISSDGNYVISASDLEYAITIRNAEDGETVFSLKEFHKSTPTCCEFSPNCDRFVSTGMDITTKVWDIKSMKTTATLNGHFNVVSSGRFSKNERYLATTSWDKSIRVWDISTGMYRSQGSTLLTKGHEGSVSCCKFSNDCQLLITGGYDTGIAIWDMQSYIKKLVIKGHEDWITGVDVSADQKWLLSSSRDNCIRIWNIEGMERIPTVMENKRSIGLKISQCEECGKFFSIAQLDDPSDITTCVFCRIADPARNTLPSIL